MFVAFQKLNSKMKNKRNQNNIGGGGVNNPGALNSLGALNVGAGRDSSNDPYENMHNGGGNNGQRVDTGGGEYLQNEDMDLMSSGNNYQLPHQQQFLGNKNFSPKGTQGKHIGALQQQKKKGSLADEQSSGMGQNGWGMNFNRQGSKKGIMSGVNAPQSNFMGNKLAFS